MLKQAKSYYEAEWIKVTSERNELKEINEALTNKLAVLQSQVRLQKFRGDDKEDDTLASKSNFSFIWIILI